MLLRHFDRRLWTSCLAAQFQFSELPERQFGSHDR
jgi:hypothetical protein